MKIYEDFNEGMKCIVCKTNKNKPCCLIAIDGTEKGSNEEAAVIHIDCIPQLRMSIDEDNGDVVFYSVIRGKLL